MTREDRPITVCSECLTAACWQGKLMCQRAKTADLVRKSIRELRALKLEHPSYWRKACEEGEA
jgi:hypothetical protein